MRDQCFGIEIEMTGISRARAALILKEYFDSRIEQPSIGYDARVVKDHQGRSWKIVSDSSIVTEKNGVHYGRDCQVEFVSPICKYDDIVRIQEIVRLLKAGGAVTNKSCGIHVHIDASKHNARTLRNITNIMASKEDLIYKALDVEVERKNSYCRPVDERFLEELNRKKPETLDRVKSIWYNGRDGSHYHYDDSRYHCLNLHSVFQKGTVEFRLFNSTLHAGRVKTYVQLCLAISHQALIQKCASRRKTESSNEKYTFRTWLLRLGMIGEEFETARYFLLKNLEGSIAWKDPEGAVRQKERLEKKKSVSETQEQENLHQHRDSGESGAGQSFGFFEQSM